MFLETVGIHTEAAQCVVMPAEPTRDLQRRGCSQGFGVATAVSDTTRYSYFFPLALNFILSLFSVNSMLVFTGISS
jgi:hypothetical protein